LGISFGSINTGLPKNIVKDIIAVEKIPLKKAQAQKKKIREKEALVNELDSHLRNIEAFLRANRSDKTFLDLAISTDEDMISVNANKDLAKPGEYRLEVERLAQRSSALSSGFPDPHKSYVGVGFIEYSLPTGESSSLFINESSATLNGVAKLINENDQTGLQATVINDGTDSETPWRLLLTFKDSGDQKVLNFPYIYLVDGEEDLYIDEVIKAHDAIIKVDGFSIETPKNQIDDLIPGLNIHLNRAQKGKEFSLNISEDIQKSTTKISGFIDLINQALKFINVQNKMNENTDTSRTLGGDIMLQTIESRIRNAVFRPVKTSSGNQRISALGIQFQKSGLLGLNQNIFFSKFNSDYKNSSEILFGQKLKDGKKTEGFFTHMQKVIKDLLNTSQGPLALKKSTFRKNINQINRQIENRERMILTKEINLKKRFARLERQISQIKGQGAGIGSLGLPPQQPKKLG
jgi:flagellar hook-associated protein 2